MNFASGSFFVFIAIFFLIWSWAREKNKRDEIQKLFIDGGLTVLSYDDNQFTSYDGSHLSEDSAVLLSIMVAEQIQQAHMGFN